MVVKTLGVRECNRDQVPIACVSVINRKFRGRTHAPQCACTGFRIRKIIQNQKTFFQHFGVYSFFENFQTYPPSQNDQRKTRRHGNRKPQTPPGKSHRRIAPQRDIRLPKESRAPIIKESLAHELNVIRANPQEDTDAVIIIFLFRFLNITT